MKFEQDEPQSSEDSPANPTVPSALDMDHLLHRFSQTHLIKFLLLFASGWAMMQLLAYFRLLIVIFVTATILAFLLSHPVTWLSRWMPRGIAAVGLFLVCLIIVIGLSATVGLAVISQGQQVIDSLREFLEALSPWLHQVEATFKVWNLNVNLQNLDVQVQNQVGQLLTTGLGLLQATLTNLITVVLTAVVTLFMLLDGAQIWWWLLQRLPISNREAFNTVVQHNLLGFFWGRLLLSIFFGSSTFLVFLTLKVPFALVLGVMAGLCDLIPGIGATLGIGLVCLILLSQSVWLAVQALIACVVLQQVEENVLLPHVMRDSLNINPVVMFFALIAGFTVAGVLGLFLAVPAAGVMVTWLNIEAMQGQTPKNSRPSVSSEQSSR